MLTAKFPIIADIYNNSPLTIAAKNNDYVAGKMIIDALCKLDKSECLDALKQVQLKDLLYF